jgi:hypothetical protein
VGWAAPAPLLVEVRELEGNQQPKSADPAFWRVWIGEEERLINWEEVAEAWQGKWWGQVGVPDDNDPIGEPPIHNE